MPRLSTAALHQLDEVDPLSWTRDEFELPSAKACGGEVDGAATYFCGNSLGLLSKAARRHMQEDLDVWSTRAVTGHFNHPHDRAFKSLEEKLVPGLAKLVGARSSEEVAHTSTLTSNIHNLLVSFYNPTPKRFKIVIEQGAFPSDWYAIHSHPGLHAGTLSTDQISEAVVSLKPRSGEHTLRTEDILKTLEEHGESVALVWLSGVHYYTGQFFEIPAISAKAHAIGALFGLDLAHAIGNVVVKLDDWNVDFAVWCTYKYLNAGPGSVGGMYIRTGLDDGGRRLAGWWGNDPDTRFQMSPTFQAAPGARGYQHSCTPVFSSIPLLATLDIIDRVGGIATMAEKGHRLTATLETLLQDSKYYRELNCNENMDTLHFKIITPAWPERGSQLSLLLHPADSMPRVFQRMVLRGVIGDEREPGVIRLTPAVLYNKFSELARVVEVLEDAMAREG